MPGDIKTLLRDQLGLPTWAVLVVVGLASHVALNLIAMLAVPVLLVAVVRLSSR